MQAQAYRQQVQNTVSAQQSLTVVKTLLTASFGCIAFVRNLLPESNFGDAFLTSGDRGRSHGPSSQLSASEGTSVSKVRIRKIMRGVSTEADKLLNYLEEGVFRAIEQQFLKSCIIAIYLDSDDPHNVVETYTYNFTYHTVPGTGTAAAPVMTLDNQLSSLSLGGRDRGDPVARATLEGKAPTLGDVKQSLRNMVRNLVVITQTMDPLPRHRFAKFKLIYNENAPADYEPPHFRPGDPEKDKFVFTTHDKSERPEKFSVGSLYTPHHGVDLQIQSVVKYIPNGEDDNVQFAGVVDGATQGTARRKGVDVNTRLRQVELQRKDADERTVVWDMDDGKWSDRDAEGSPDPDFLNDSGIGMHEIPIATESQHRRRNDEMETNDDAQFYGRQEHPPSRVGKMRAKDKRRATDSVQPTQLLEPTQAVSSADSSMVMDTSESSAQEQTAISAMSKGVDTQLLMNLMEQQSESFQISGGHEILDLETQPVDGMPFEEPTHAIGENFAPEANNVMLAKTSKSTLDDADCACGFSDADDLVFCDGECNKWHHLWCMGFHSDRDKSLPSSFVCWPCRLQALPTFEMMKEDYPGILFRLEEVARFRRAVKFAEVHNPDSLKAFRNLVGGNANLAEQLWKQLENEGFIEEVVTETDALGLVETRSRQTRSNKNKKKAQSTRTSKYAFVQAIKKSPIYQQYFSPDDMEVEQDLLQIPDVEKKINRGMRRADRKEKHDATEHIDASCSETGPTPHLNAQRGDDDAEQSDIDMETQTQDETQYPLAMAATGTVEPKKRSHSNQTIRNAKKMKISVGDGVDLED